MPLLLRLGRLGLCLPLRLQCLLDVGTHHLQCAAVVDARAVVDCLKPGRVFLEGRKAKALGVGFRRGIAGNELFFDLPNGALLPHPQQHTEVRAAVDHNHEIEVLCHWHFGDRCLGRCWCPYLLLLKWCRVAHGLQLQRTYASDVDLLFHLLRVPHSPKVVCRFGDELDGSCGRLTDMQLFRHLQPEFAHCRVQPHGHHHSVRPRVVLRPQNCQSDGCQLRPWLWLLPPLGCRNRPLHFLLGPGLRWLFPRVHLPRRRRCLRFLLDFGLRWAPPLV
mmetsp:Transcript_10134/g.23881  ORF Transcript_10134/g.23881 Transcript_10134/m.23881 type:complete len:276 (+) Transcript_10134:452-1279(+)